MARSQAKWFVLARKSKIDPILACFKTLSIWNTMAALRLRIPLRTFNMTKAKKSLTFALNFSSAFKTLLSFFKAPEALF